MNLKKLFFSFAIFVTFAANAQTKSKDILFTIDDKPYYTDEFSRVYKKNLDLVKDESQKDLNQYLELFIGYKLKVNKAYKLGLQNGQAYQNELKSYRTQLAKNYFNDTKITQELIEEGYNRLQKEVRASHILILVDENAAPADTLVAYNKLKDIRNRILKGEKFEDLASQLSEDPSAKDNKGDLGYFTAFRMVYPFECAAFTTPKGEVSKIIRTRFGYHILKVNDIRPNRGEVTVAHIMILNPKPEDEDQNKAENTINDIYKKINQGEKFEELAKQFSEDKSSSTKGGVLNKFSSGQLSSEEFETVAFSLKTPNEISKPFKSQFGWHIIKLIEKHPVKTLDEMKFELENKIGKDERSKKIVESLNEKLRKKYKFKKETKQVAAVAKLVTNDVYEGKWQIPTTGIDENATILTIENKKVDTKKFLEFVEKQQKATAPIKPVAKLVDALFEKFTDEQLNAYYDENLETEFPEFSYVMEEYRDGLLLFDLMEKEIWNRSKTDTLGLEKFYEANKNSHMWKKRIEATIFSSTKKDMIEKALALLKKGSSPQEIKDKLNTKEVVNIMINANIFEEGNETIPKGTKFEKGVSPIIKEGEYYFATKVDKVLPEGVKTLEECKGKLTNEYQQYLEQHWVDELKGEFTVKVNQDVFNKVKADLKL
ncbi:peptidylprolyl isomerase [Flavobacterium capsici]|uniref:Peptidylprolyl isomerase n=1 Tax=Flavobacterium capsici TaxID=3075618 RepID=A0AA96F5G4_9FLAO|nr:MULTISPECIES: peptidylprolyl isomerase [unclassified Flavobacterium]WNM19045.1 peptidylprolyl isomerase [Flavobacterium sp. PMR2A8]WNM23095.1 peptidylprolyl isomerase [Flavobacterium sp. PMTSA4]